MKRIAILGCTGSIGCSTLNVIESHPERFQVVALAAGSNLELALQQAQRWKPKVLSVGSENQADQARRRLRSEKLESIEVVHGESGTVQVATMEAQGAFGRLRKPSGSSKAPTESTLGFH